MPQTKAWCTVPSGCRFKQLNLWNLVFGVTFLTACSIRVVDVSGSQVLKFVLEVVVSKIPPVCQQLKEKPGAAFL